MRAWRTWRTWRAAAKWRLFTGCDQSGSLSTPRGSAFCSQSVPQSFPVNVRCFSHQVELSPEEDDESFSALCGLVESKPDSFEAIKEWKSDGNQLSRETMSKLYSWLNGNRRIVQTLKILAGIRKENLVKLTLDDYVFELDLTCRQHGCAKGEAFYNSLPEDIKGNDKVKTGLIISFAKQLAVSKVEKWMKELNVVDVEAWSRVLELYLNRDKHDKVVETYEKMKELGIEVNADSFCTLLKCKDKAGSIQDIEKDAEECLQKVDLTVAPRTSLKQLVEAYGYLKKPDQVDKVWNILKCKLHGVDEGFYSIAIRAFGAAGDVSRAEKVLEELLTSDKAETLSEHPYVAMIDAYARLGYMDKAEEILGAKIKRKPKDSNFLPYDYIIQGYVAKNESSSALQKYQEGATNRSKLQYKTVEGLLKIFASRRDVEAAEKMFHQHYLGYHGDANLYNQLLEVYVSAIRIPRDFRKRLQNNFVDANEETEELLKRLPSYVPSS